MNPWTCLDQLAAWRAAAPDAAAAVRAGDLSPAAALLSGWRVASDPALLRGSLERLADAALQPSPQAWAMTMTATPDPSLAGPALWRSAAFQQADPDGLVGDPLAWALVELAIVGALVEAELRAPWRGERFEADPARDSELASLWAGWVDRSIFLHRRAWEDATLAFILRAFAAVLHGRRVPEQRRARALDDAREGCFFNLLGSDDASASWRELAVRVIESGDAGPVDALATALPPADLGRVARCAVARGYSPITARLVWGPDSDPLVQQRDLERRLRASSADLGVLLDLHVLTRLTDRWTQPATTAPDRTWNVIRNNRGRARARLRAVLRDAPAQWLVDRVVAQTALAARTRRAAARFGRDWAWQALQNGLSFDDGRCLDPGCKPTDDGLRPYTDDERLQIRAWLLSVVLKGRLRHLLAWVYREGRDDVDVKDATWGRLLKDEIPAGLRSAGRGSSRGAGLLRLRGELLERVPDMLQDLAPAVAAVAAIEYRPRKARAAFDAAIAPVLHPAVPRPHKQIRRYIDHAAAALDSIDAVVARSTGGG